MRRGGPKSIVTIVVLVWLVIGLVAAFQRDYFKSSDTNCAGAGTIALTIIAGPLNYLGLKPEVKACDVPPLPQPSP